MSTDVGAAYAMLTIDGPEDPARLNARPVGLSTADGDVLVGLDGAGRRHLLIPAGGHPVVEDVRSRGVRLTKRDWRRSVDAAAFADLECRDPRLGLVFERLVEDVLRRIARRPERALDEVHRALDDWREMLRAAGAEVSRETVLGLVGELEVLASIGSSGFSAALDAWHGPDMSVHDFSRGGRAIEVKATASVDGNFVQLSNLDQLDPGGLETLHLVAVHCRERDIAPSLDDRIRQLVDAGCPHGALVDAVARAGYVFESGTADSLRFEVRSLRVWQVDANFPGLRASDIQDGRRRGVGRVRYELALDAAPSPLPAAHAKDVLERWITA